MGELSRECLAAAGETALGLGVSGKSAVPRGTGKWFPYAGGVLLAWDGGEAVLNLQMIKSYIAAYGAR